MRRPLLIVLALAITAIAWSAINTRVRIDNFKFQTDKLVIAKGSSVTWMNEDDIPHSIVLTALAVRSKVLDSNEVFTFQFDKAGTYSYICGLHPFMKGQIVVK